MALDLLILLTVAAVLRAYFNWREGLIWMIVIATVQDPLRKLVPGAPGTLLLLVTIIFLAMALGLLEARRHVLAAFLASVPEIRRPLGWLLLATVPPALISLLYGPGSWIFTLFGLLSYGSILFSIPIGFYFLRSGWELRRLLAFYCLLSTLALSGTFLEYFNVPGFGLLIGTGAFDYSWIRYNETDTIQLLAGFYRSPDVMGWHASAVAMFSLLLAFTGRAAGRWNWLLITAFAIGALLVSGRRKMVFMVPLFILITVVLLAQNRRRGLDIQSLLLILALLLIGFSIGDWLGPDSGVIHYYTSSSDDLVVQTQRHGWESVLTTYEQNGFWGLGLGFASPGAQNIGAARPFVWQESGLSRVMAELGLPGFTLLLWLIAVILRACIRTSRLLHRQNSPYGVYAVGLLAFVLANFASLTISGQILADPFIASFLGIAIGMQLSLGRMAATAGGASLVLPQAPARLLPS